MRVRVYMLISLQALLNMNKSYVYAVVFLNSFIIAESGIVFHLNYVNYTPVHIHHIIIIVSKILLSHDCVS